MQTDTIPDLSNCSVLTFVRWMWDHWPNGHDAVKAAIIKTQHDFHRKFMSGYISERQYRRALAQGLAFHRLEREQERRRWRLLDGDDQPQPSDADLELMCEAYDGLADSCAGE